MKPSTPHKVVLITGASSGIGRAAAMEFAAAQYRVVLVARRLQRLAEVADIIERRGGEALVLPADVAEREQIERAVEVAMAHWGRIDVLVNNAGFGVFGMVEECLPEDFEQQIRVNYLAAVYATKMVLPRMRLQGHGAIINVSSIAGHATSLYDAPYCASKSALNAFTAILRMELHGTGISVSLVSPGYTKTEWEDAVVQRRRFDMRTPLRPIPAQRVARAIANCVEHPQRTVLIPRILVLTVWLQALLPGVHEWRQRRFRK